MGGRGKATKEAIIVETGQIDQANDSWLSKQRGSSLQLSNLNNCPGCDVHKFNCNLIVTGSVARKSIVDSIK